MSRRGNRGGRRNRRIVPSMSSRSVVPQRSNNSTTYNKDSSAMGSHNNNYLSISDQVRNHFFQEETKKKPQEQHARSKHVLKTISGHTLDVYSSPGMGSYGSNDTTSMKDGGALHTGPYPHIGTTNSTSSSSMHRDIYSKTLRIYLPYKAQQYNDDNSLEEYMTANDVNPKEVPVDNNGASIINKDCSDVRDKVSCRYGPSFFYQPQEFSMKFQHNILHRCNPLMKHLEKKNCNNICDGSPNEEGQEINKGSKINNNSGTALMGTTFRLKTLKAKELSGLVCPTNSCAKSGNNHRIEINEVTPLIAHTAPNSSSHLPFLSCEYLLRINGWRELPPNPLIGMHGDIPTAVPSSKNESKDRPSECHVEKGVSDSHTRQSSGSVTTPMSGVTSNPEHITNQKKTEYSNSKDSEMNRSEKKEDHHQPHADKMKKGSSPSSFYCDACQKEFGDQNKFDIHNSTAHIQCTVPGCNFKCRKDKKNSDWKMEIHMMALHRRPNAPDLTNTDAYLANRMKNYPTTEKIKAKIEELYYRSAKGEILPEEKRRWLQKVGGIHVKRPSDQLMAKVDTTGLPSGTPIFINGGDRLLTEYKGNELGSREPITTGDSSDKSYSFKTCMETPRSSEQSSVKTSQRNSITANAKPVTSEELNDYKAQILQGTAALQRLVGLSGKEQDTAKQHTDECITPPSAYVCTRCNAIGEHWSAFCSSGHVHAIDGNTVPTSVGHKRTREDDIIADDDKTGNVDHVPSASAGAAEALQKQTKLLLCKKNKLMDAMRGSGSSTVAPTQVPSSTASLSIRGACHDTNIPETSLQRSNRAKREVHHVNSSTVRIPSLFDRLVYDEKARHNGLLLQAFRYFVREDFFGEEEYVSCSSGRTTTK
eukprot:Tbor_TRINITY_DN5455_c3_g1::TRINITY_DN5455_c3_g1_i1::g.24803::m.24803